PYEIADDVARDRLAQQDAAEGCLLDGYPRACDQVRERDAMLADRDLGLDAVVELTADDEVVVQRLLGRAAEQNRADDTDVVIRRRLEVYHDQTTPLRSEEHTSELQSRENLVCRLLLEKKKKYASYESNSRNKRGR